MFSSIPGFAPAWYGWTYAGFMAGGFTVATAPAWLSIAAIGVTTALLVAGGIRIFDAFRQRAKAKKH